MRHWHKCARWTRFGLDCPFRALELEHDDPEDDEVREPTGIPLRLLVAKKDEKAKVSKVVQTQLDEILKTVPPPTGGLEEPFIPAPPPHRTPVPTPNRPRTFPQVPYPPFGDPVPIGGAPQAARVPARARVTVPALEAAKLRSVVEDLYRSGVGAGFNPEGVVSGQPTPPPFLDPRTRPAQPRLVPLSPIRAAFAEQAVADETRGRLSGARIATAAAVVAGAAGLGYALTKGGGPGGGGFSFNAAARYRQLLLGFSGARHFGIPKTDGP